MNTRMDLTEWGQVAMFEEQPALADVRLVARGVAGPAFAVHELPTVVTDPRAIGRGEPGVLGRVRPAAPGFHEDVGRTPMAVFDVGARDNRIPLNGDRGADHGGHLLVERDQLRGWSWLTVRIDRRPATECLLRNTGRHC